MSEWWQTDSIDDAYCDGFITWAEFETLAKLRKLYCNKEARP